MESGEYDPERMEPSDTARRTFPSTHLSLVELVARGEAPGFRAAWERFFQGYWPPLYGYLRRTGSQHEDALDLLQEFFLEGAEGSVMRAYDPSRGRLRSYLLGCLQNRRRQVHRREGSRPDRQRLPWLGEEGAALEPPAADPEEAFEREWARQVQRRSIAIVAARLAAEGDRAAERLLREWVLASERPPAADLAAALGISPGNLYVRATRLRQALSAEVEAQVALFAGDPADAERERDGVLRLLRGGPA